MNGGLDSVTSQTSLHDLYPPEAVQRQEEGSKLELYQAENNHQSESQQFKKKKGGISNYT